MLQEILPGALVKNKQFITYYATNETDAAAMAAADAVTEYGWLGPDGKLKRVGGIILPRSPYNLSALTFNDGARTVSLSFNAEALPVGVAAWGGDVYTNCQINVQLYAASTNSYLNGYNATDDSIWGTTVPAPSLPTAVVNVTITIPTGTAENKHVQPSAVPTYAAVWIENSVGAGPRALTGVLA